MCGVRHCSGFIQVPGLRGACPDSCRVWPKSCPEPCGVTSLWCDQPLSRRECKLINAQPLLTRRCVSWVHALSFGKGGGAAQIASIRHFYRIKSQLATPAKPCFLLVHDQSDGGIHPRQPRSFPVHQRPRHPRCQLHSPVCLLAPADRHLTWNSWDKAHNQVQRFQIKDKI